MSPVRRTEDYATLDIVLSNWFLTITANWVHFVSQTVSYRPGQEWNNAVVVREWQRVGGRQLPYVSRWHPRAGIIIPSVLATETTARGCGAHTLLHLIMALPPAPPGRTASPLGLGWHLGRSTLERELRWTGSSLPSPVSSVTLAGWLTWPYCVWFLTYKRGIMI